MDSAETWFARDPDAPRAADLRLFCFPYAGGNAATFLAWQPSLAPRIEVRVATPPGRGIRMFQPPMVDFDALVGKLASAVTALGGRRFAFFGHSLGALLAFEVTRLLRRQGRSGPEQLWVSGAEGPQTRQVKRVTHDLPDADLIEILREYDGTPAELLDDGEMMQLLLPGLRADFALDETYSCRPEAPLDIPIHMLHGAQDPYVDADRASGWGLESTQPLREHIYPGDHFFIEPHRDAITARLAAELTRAGAGARGDGARP